MGILTIACHVGCNEHPLRQLVLVHVLLEHGQRLRLGQSVRLLRYRIVQHGWVMLADVHVGSSFRVRVGFSLEANRRHVFLVLAPAHTFVFEEVYQCGYVGGNRNHVVVVDAIVVTRYRCGVVGHRGVGYSKVVRKADAFLCEPC